MRETTSSLVALNSRQRFVGPPARAAYLLVAGAALVASLGCMPAPRAAPLWTLPEAPVPQYGPVQVVAPAWPSARTAVEAVDEVAPASMAVVLIEGLAPAAPVAPPQAVTRVQDVASDRDAWAREPAALGRRPAAVKASSEAPAPVKGVLETPARVKVVPETPARLKGPIAQAALRYGLPSEVLSAALARESANFKDRYVYGYHVDGTGRGVAGIDKRFHPEVSDEQALDPGFAIDWMGRHLSAILRKNGGDMYSALREYNGGPNFASERPGYQGRPVSELTRTHADRIMAHAARAVLT